MAAFQGSWPHTWQQLPGWKALKGSQFSLGPGTVAPLMLPEEFDVGAHEAAVVTVERVMGPPVQLHALLAPKEQGAASERTGHGHRGVGLPQVLLQALAIFSREHTARLWAGEGVGSTPVNLEVALQGLGLGKLLPTHRAWQGAIWEALALQRARETEVARGQLYRAWGAREALQRLYKGLRTLVQGQQSGLSEALLTALTVVHLQLHHLYQDTCRQRTERERHRIRRNETHRS